MTKIPPPSQLIIMDLLKAVAHCREGKPEEAARELIASARTIEVTPTMITDLYHLANAAIKLGIEHYINYQGLMQIIDTMKSEDIQLSGPSWVGDLYQDTNSQDNSFATASAVSPHWSEMDQRERHATIQKVDLDDFTQDQLLKMGISLLKHGTWAYEQRNLDEALTCFRDSFRIAKHLEYPEGIATCLFEIGFVIHSRGDGAFAEEHYRDALEMAANLSPETRRYIARYVFHAGRFFELEGNTSKARGYFQKSLLMFEESDDTEGIQACHNKLRQAQK